MKKSHSPRRSKQEKRRYTKAVMKCDSDPTIPRNDLGSTISEIDCDEETNIQGTKRRRSKSNRFKLHLIDNWPAYLIAFIATIGGIYLLTIVPKINELSSNATSTKEQIKEINNNITSNYNDLNQKISKFSSDVKSLQDQFRLFIEMMKKE